MHIRRGADLPYGVPVPDELVFSVDKAGASRARSITLAEAGLTERADLQEWVIANPEILGSNVRVITFEFDRWRNASGDPERDRLDVLGLDPDGHLVVAELKRDRAPDTVEMQAIKYAAMASRFSPDSLAAVHARYLSTPETSVSEDQARDILNDHTTFALDASTLREPRIVLVAGSFPPVVTASAVWLTEMGVKFTLIQIQAYRLGSDAGSEIPGEVVITVSQQFPVPDVEDFMVGPRRAEDAAPARTGPQLPQIDWTDADYARLRSFPPRETVQSILDLCSSQPGEPVPLRSIEAAAGVTTQTAKGHLAGLTMMVKSRFGRTNWPFTMEWNYGGDNQAYYVMTPEQSELWLASDIAEPDTSEPTAPTAELGESGG